jgi:hypothetical protein
MIADEDDNVRAEVRPLEVVWRNPQRFVVAKLRLRESSNLYGWANEL